MTSRRTLVLALLLCLTVGVIQGCHLLFPFSYDRLEDAGVPWPESGVDTLPLPADATPSDLLTDDLRTDGPVGQDLIAPDSNTFSPPGTWVTISPGSFTMGSPTSEPCRQAGETQHKVTLTHKFLIQTTEVTQAQFKLVMGFNPATFPGCGPDCAVEGINYHLAAAYCNALSIKTGLSRCYACSGLKEKTKCTTNLLYPGQKVYDCLGYRLPTEAEWEYAYRAGSATALYSGGNNPKSCTGCGVLDTNADAIGWYLCNKSSGSGAGVQPVGKKAPNAWGLYDMAGNLWEWCHDRTVTYPGSPVVNPVGTTTSTHRVLRGGSWNGGAALMRAAQRTALELHMSGGSDGVRCVRHIK